MQRVWIADDDDRLGELVMRLDGTTATVVALAVRPGISDYYNLTVSQVHTYAVGAGQFVVHNGGGGGDVIGSAAEGTGAARRAGCLVRILEPAGPTPRRESFTDALDNAINPFTGEQPVPLPGRSGKAWKDLFRFLTHMERGS